MGQLIRSLLVALLGGTLGAGFSGAISLAASSHDAAAVAATIEAGDSGPLEAALEEALVSAMHHDADDEDQTGRNDRDEKARLPGRGHVLKVARGYLGLTEADLQSALRSGKSLAELAAEKGKARDGLIGAVLASLDVSVDKEAARKVIEKIVDAKVTPKARVAPKGLAERLVAVLDGLVAAGKLSAVQREQILEAFKTAALRTPRPVKPESVRPSGEVYRAAREYLGVTQQEIEKSHKNGTSLAELAVAKGKTRDGLVQAILDAVTRADPSVDRAKAAEAIGKIVDQKPKVRPSGKPTPKPTASPAGAAAAFGSAQLRAQPFNFGSSGYQRR